MNPEARIAITATDQTAAAFRSAVDNVEHINHSIRGATRTFREFGLALGTRELVEWLNEAAKTAQVTDDQRAALKDAGAAMEQLNESAKTLAASLMSELAPAIQSAAEWWQQLLFPTGEQKVGGDLDKMHEQVSAIAKELVGLQNGGQVGHSAWNRWFGDPEARAKELREQLAALLPQMRQMEAEQEKLRNAPNMQLEELDTELIKLQRFPKFFADFSKGSYLTPALAEFIEQVKTASKLLDGLQTPLEKQIALVKQYRDAIAQGLMDPSALNTLADQLLEPINVTARRLKELKPETEKWAREIGDSMKSAFAGWLSGTETSFRDLLRRMAAEFLSSALFSALAQTFGGGGGFWGSFFGGAKASGGPVSAGRGYLVGEKGPEWFSPSQSGTIIPNGVGGGPAINITNHVDARGADPSAASGIQAALAKNNQLVIAQIRDLMRRGRFAT